MKWGHSDLNVTSASMLYAYIGNLTGIPGISIPVGYTLDEKLPIGIQFMSTWWNEKMLLQIANEWDALMIRQKPQVYVRLFESK